MSEESRHRKKSEESPVGCLEGERGGLGWYVGGRRREARI